MFLRNSPQGLQIHKCISYENSHHPRPPTYLIPIVFRIDLRFHVAFQFVLNFPFWDSLTSEAEAVGISGDVFPVVWRQENGANERKESTVGGDVRSPSVLQGEGLSLKFILRD